jgi:hypothetical protein
MFSKLKHFVADWRIILTQSMSQSVGEMLCFLPVIFAWVKAKYVTLSPSIQLDEESEEEDSTDTNEVLPHTLTGWKILLFWIPALCDLTGTTVWTF